MHKFIFTSDKFDGEIELHYDENQLLANFDIRAELSDVQHIWLLRRFPRDLFELYKLPEINPNIKITQLEEEITFEMFWNRYNEKALSSKKRTLAIWNKMRKIEQRKAYQFIFKYFSMLPLGVRKKYAEYYLLSELWNN